jgi:hypothetical protein
LLTATQTLPQNNPFPVHLRLPAYISHRSRALGRLPFTDEASPWNTNVNPMMPEEVKAVAAATGAPLGLAVVTPKSSSGFSHPTDYPSDVSTDHSTDPSADVPTPASLWDIMPPSEQAHHDDFATTQLIDAAAMVRG